MEFIARLHDRATMAELRGRLRAKGIPTHESAMEGRVMGYQSALFVCLAEQAEDARRLIKDPGHEPAFRVDAEAFERALLEQDSRQVAKLVTVTGMIVVVAVAAVVYLVWHLSSGAVVPPVQPANPPGSRWWM